MAKEAQQQGRKLVWCWGRPSWQSAQSTLGWGFKGLRLQHKLGVNTVPKPTHFFLCPLTSSVSSVGALPPFLNLETGNGQRPAGLLVRCTYRDRVPVRVKELIFLRFSSSDSGRRPASAQTAYRMGAAA